MKAIDKAVQLGATISYGINWIWAIGFTPENAKTFLAWLNDNNYDHRGIYPNNDGVHKDIRFR